jgi:uncharacterized phage protein gp47/JayE
MAEFNFPANRKEVSDRIKTDVQGELPSSNPFLKNSFLSAIITGLAGRVFDFFLQLEVLTKQMFPDTATEAFLERWASYKGVTRDPATQATGILTATGTAGNSIPDDTTLTTSDGLEYTTDGVSTIATNVVSVSTLTRSGTTATATTASNHNLASGMSVVMAGANETEYNGTVTITVTGLTTFTYEVTGSPATPATGTITVTSDSASVSIISTEFGQDQNQDSGTELTFSSAISGVDNVAIVQFGAIGGGTDLQSDEDLRVEVIERYANPVSTFNVAAIEKKIKEVSGITRVFVEEITPAVGQVTTYFTRDNDASIIPSASEVTTAKNKLLEIKPAHVDDNDVIVSAPTGVTVDFTFSTLSPNTSTMQAAITANLQALFRDDTTVGEDLKEDSYRSTIFNTIDPDTGDSVVSFTLSTPTTDVTIASGELPVLGNITYP